MKKKSQIIKQTAISIPPTMHMLTSKMSLNNHLQQTYLNSNPQIKQENPNKNTKIGIKASARQTTQQYSHTKNGQSSIQQSKHQQIKTMYKKMTRSISSLGRKQQSTSKLHEKTPEKKNSLSRFRHLHNNSNFSNHNNNNNTHKSNQSVLEKITDIFTLKQNCYKIKNQEDLIKKCQYKFQKSIDILKQSFQNTQFIKCFEQLQKYMMQIIGKFIQFNENKINKYYCQVQEIVNDYQQKLKKQKQQITHQLFQNIIDPKGDSDFSHALIQLKMKALFSTKIFNQMQISGIDLQNWVKRSKLMQAYTEIMDQYQIDNIKMNQIDTDDKTKLIQNQEIYSYRHKNINIQKQSRKSEGCQQQILTNLNQHKKMSNKQQRNFNQFSSGVNNYSCIFLQTNQQNGQNNEHAEQVINKSSSIRNYTHR